MSGRNRTLRKVIKWGAPLLIVVGLGACSNAGGSTASSTEDQVHDVVSAVYTKYEKVIRVIEPDALNLDSGDIARVIEKSCATGSQAEADPAETIAQIQIVFGSLLEDIGSSAAEFVADGAEMQEQIVEIVGCEG